MVRALVTHQLHGSVVRALVTHQLHGSVLNPELGTVTSCFDFVTGSHLASKTFFWGGGGDLEAVDVEPLCGMCH